MERSRGSWARRHAVSLCRNGEVIRSRNMHEMIRPYSRVSVLPPPLIDEVFMSEKCENCKYFESTSKHGGYCRRFPPTVYPLVVEGESEVRTRSPYVINKEWCGEHEFDELSKNSGASFAQKAPNLRR